MQVRDHFLSHETFTLKPGSFPGMLRTTPVPNRDVIGNYYTSEKYFSHTDSGGGIVGQLYRWVRNYQLAQKIRRLTKGTRGDARFLDIGTGTGALVHRLHALGKDAWGVEPFAKAEHSNIVDSLDKVTGTFDVISLFHVLEHDHNPADLLKKVKALSAPGARIHIAVPNHASADARHYKKNWGGYDVPRHLSHWSRSSLERYVSHFGFTLQSSKPMWFDAPYVCYLSETYTGRSKAVAFLIGMLIGSWSNIRAVFTGQTSSRTYIFHFEP